MRLWPKRRPARRPPRRPIAIYAWYDADDRPLYVGMSDQLGRRTHEHFWQALWVHDATCMRILGWYMNRTEAKTAERKAIKALRPGRNVVHNQPPAPRVAAPTSPPAELSRQDATKQLEELLREMLLHEGATDVGIADIMRRWPHRSRPWLHAELQRLTDAGWLEKLPPLEPYGPIRYRPTPALSEGGLGGRVNHTLTLPLRGRGSNHGSNHDANH